jgi:hypothetical protein
MQKRFVLLLLLVAGLGLAGCRTTQPTPQIRVSVVADGRERTFLLPGPTTVGEFLRDPKVDIQLGDLDRINPPQFTQITDGTRITIARVTEQNECEQSEIPYKQTTALNEGLQPGEQRIVQAGQGGVLEICYRVSVVDGVPGERVETNRTVIRDAQDEIIYIGPTGEIEPVPIVGTLAYINNGNAWIMRTSSTTKRPITTESDLDPRVFSLSADGQQLLFTRKSVGEDATSSFNQLWSIQDVSQPSPAVALIPSNILYADWVPGLENTISYSTGEPREATPGWLAFNDLWQMRIDPTNGDSLSVKQIIERSTGGLYGWWGTRFQWSPDGTRLAWAQANGIGLVNLEDGTLDSGLMTYAVLRPVGDWSWRATLSWSPDGNLLLSTVHGAPTGSELAESSPVFNVAVSDTGGTFATDVIPNAGIWAAPQYSPLLSDTNSQFPKGYLAYLMARDPFSSINGEYDLMVADRDGSNPRTIFPPSGRLGLTAQQSIFQNQEFVWSPDGRQIALIYQGNLWVVDVESMIAHQLTLDGGASNPVWAR